MYPNDIQQWYANNLESSNDVSLTSGSLIAVDIASQTATLFERFTEAQHYPVSTSRFGVGNTENSFRTPLGLHEIAEKIGADSMAGEVFLARQPQGRCYDKNDLAEGKDIITSRILWLRGLQESFNSGKACDSFQRYIYIHGTADELNIGKPASIGCIRMRNSDVIDLFERVEVGCRVLICG